MKVKSLGVGTSVSQEMTGFRENVKYYKSKGILPDQNPSGRSY